MTSHRPYYDPQRDETWAALHADELDRLRESLNLLSDFDKTIITLRCFDKLSNHETAERLGLKDQAASMRYLRATRRLRKLMGKEPNED